MGRGGLLACGHCVGVNEVSSGPSMSDPAEYFSGRAELSTDEEQTDEEADPYSQPPAQQPGNKVRLWAHLPSLGSGSLILDPQHPMRP